MDEQHRKQLICSRRMDGCMMILASILFAGIVVVQQTFVGRLTASVVPVSFFVAGAWRIISASRNSGNGRPQAG
jgi:hypothetical protein